MNYAGKEIHRTYRSPREAIAFAAAKRRGPAARRQRWDDSHGSYTPTEAAEVVFALLTQCGAPPDSPARAAVMRWACAKGDRTATVSRVERAMRNAMGEAGLLDDGGASSPTERFAFTDTVGQAHEHLVAALRGEA